MITIMKIKTPLNRPCLSIFVISVAILFFCFQAFGQEEIEVSFVNNRISPPAEEKFIPTDALATPWRSSGCQINTRSPELDCYTVSAEERMVSHILTLYDENGLLWHRFSVSSESPVYFFKYKKEGFLPFATGGLRDWPMTVFLRMVGESPNWYKVEVNETTRETKYAPKTDRMWSKTSWSYWLYFRTSFEVDFSLTPLYDKPDGRILDETSDLDTELKSVFIKAEGDWAYVVTSQNQKRYEGWIRWREGRNLLVKIPYFNVSEVPEDETEDEENL